MTCLVKTVEYFLFKSCFACHFTFSEAKHVARKLNACTRDCGSGNSGPEACCDPRLVVVPWPVIGCPKAGRRTLDDPSASADHPMTGHRTAQTSGRRPSALTNQIWFPAENWLPPKIACEKEILETWIMLCMKNDSVVIANYFCTMTFRY